MLHVFIHGAKSKSNYVIFNVFSNLNKSLLGKSLEKYNSNLSILIIL